MVSISEFFRTDLNAELRNVRWSWGAIDHSSGNVFLRVWSDQFLYRNGSQYVLVLGDWKSNRQGFKEREIHLEAISQGSRGYGVVCVAVDEGSRNRKIKYYDPDNLLVFDSLESFENKWYAKVRQRIPTRLLKMASTPGDVASDLLNAVTDTGVTATQAERLAQARVGQGKFRADLLRAWANQCAVTGSQVLEAIRASHIKPWKYSNDNERLDSSNGLPLIANLDALFDAGLISFSDNGQMLISNELAKRELTLLGVAKKKLRKAPSARMKKYLEFHRQEIFKGSFE